MYAFLLDHEQGRAIKVTLPKEVEDSDHSAITLWLSSRYAIENTVDFMLTDFDTIIEEDHYKEKLDNNPMYDMIEQFRKDLEDSGHAVDK